MSALTLNPLTYDGLSFTNIGVTETDIGIVAPFTLYPGQFQGVGTPTGAGLSWGAVNAGAYYAGSSEVLNFNYTVSSTSSSTLIDSIGQIYVTDSFSGPGITLTAVENVYDTAGDLIGTETFIGGVANPAVVMLTQAEQTVNVTITLTMAIDATGTSASGVSISTIQQTFGTIAAPPQTASIGDIAFADQNATGLESGFDAGPGVAGVTVELLNSTGTSVLATTTTDSNGLYNFSGLAAGVYEVEFIAPTGYGYSPEGVGSNAAINSSANVVTGITAPITLTAGEADHNVEVGLVPVGTASIGNTVWLDANRDGLYDNGEQGVAGVTVDLLSGTGSIIATTTTDSSGTYQFTNLDAGTYEVTFQAPAGDNFTTQNVSPGTTGDLNNVANSAGLTAPITLTTGEVDNNVNAGLETPPAALGDYV
ncbi:MAG: serine-aspartate repeat-containing protein, partial [Acetobacteraceae bacterium]|nr:serine-aspartate repeat-containing protein [Acetobacteraceae bacterium]